MTEALKENTALNVQTLIKEGNPNVATAVLYNEGYKAAIREVHAWLTTD